MWEYGPKGTRKPMDELRRSKMLRATVLCGLVFTVIVPTLIWVGWGWLHGDGAGPSNSETLRNVGLLVAGVFAFAIAIWRAKVADQQSLTAKVEAETSKQGLLYDRFQRGAQMLGSESLSVRLAGIYSLEQLAKDDPEQYHIQIIQSFCSFVTNPSRNSEPRELPSGQAANAEQATRQDIRAAMYALGKRSEVGKSLEREAEIRLDLRSASLVGCDLSEMDFSNALLGGADLTLADLFNCQLIRADLRQTILTKAKLGGTNFSGATLFSTNFSLATCEDAKFDNTSIYKSNLSGATLTKASFNGTIFSDTVLVNASLKEAAPSWAYFSTEENELAALSVKIGLTQSQLNEAQWNSWTPPNLNGLLDAKALEPLVVNGDLIHEESSSKEPSEDAD